MNSCKILLVDDEEDIVNLIEEVLVSDGFIHIYKAYSGIEAIQLCRQIEPDVIVLDVMPDQLSKEQYQIEKLGMKFRLMQI